MGLKVSRIGGALILAKRHGHISSARQLLDRLENEAGFWLAPNLKALAIKRAGE